MGAVYLAKQLSQDRLVALKILPKEMATDEEFLERFRREARAAMKLVHPNIVAAYDIGVAENYHYIAMEYVDGKDLESILTEKGRFDEKELLKAAHDIASALEAAEAKGIVHRDIKPSNILRNSNGESKLIDMGLSSASQGDRRVTMAGFAVGTPYYISPEQARGTLDVDGRSDIYSLGATLYHLSTGKLPFPGTNPVVIMTQHITETPRAPHEREPSVSKHISAMIMKMMAKDPAQRYQKASELKAHIERVMKGEAPLMAVAPAISKQPPQKKVDAAKGTKPSVPMPPDNRTTVTAGSPAPKFDLPLDERILRAVDQMFPFVPKNARLAVAAVSLTVVLLALIFFAVLTIMK